MKKNSHFYPELKNYIKDLLPEMAGISETRKNSLERVANYIAKKRAAGEEVHLTFICTHNSRRSHFGQIWAATAAAWYGIDRVFTYSGGTEATAFNPRAVAAAERAGFKIKNPGGDNPHYEVSFAENGLVLACFSKTYDDPHNPQSDFAAIMTCSDADENCPFIPGAELRAPITYEDPKAADGTPAETARYDERCRQIAMEMFYLFSRVDRSSSMKQ